MAILIILKEQHESYKAHVSKITKMVSHYENICYIGQNEHCEN